MLINGQGIYTKYLRFPSSTSHLHTLRNSKESIKTGSQQEMKCHTDLNH